MSAVAAGVRRILHCDMDCFYAAVHMRDDPALRGQPVVIGGSPDSRGVVAAASYEVRRFGVRSAMPAARAVRLCPQAVFIRPDFARYKAESKEIFEIFRRYTEVVQPVSIDEAYLDVTEWLEPWGSATAVATEIRRRVKAERGLDVSIGVGPSKLVAKIASDHGKPDGLVVVKPGRVRAFLSPLPARSLPGVGPATERRLAKLGIATVGELAAADPALLVATFGRHGRSLHAFAHGRDERPVSIERERKSLSAERTFDRDLERRRQMVEELARLAEKVAAGLERRGIAARTVTIKVRYPDFTTLTRSQTLAAPTADAGRIGGTAKALLERTEAAGRGVRLLGVGASGLEPGGLEQLELFGGEARELREVAAAPSAPEA